MSCFFGSRIAGNLRLERGDDLGRVVHRQRGLRDERDALGIGQLQREHVLDALDQVHAALDLAHRALDLGVALVADHHDVDAVLAHLRDFDVDLGDQRAGRVVDAQPAHVGFVAHRLRHAVRAEDHGVAGRHFLEFLDEDRALLLQILDHVLVVHDLVTHVDRRAVHRDRALDDLDRAIDAGAEAARLGEQDFGVGRDGLPGQRIGDAHDYRIPMIFTSNVSACPASG